MAQWINYPYATNQLMKDAADSCHSFGMKFKIYVRYTATSHISIHMSNLPLLRLCMRCTEHNARAVESL